MDFINEFIVVCFVSYCFALLNQGATRIVFRLRKELEITNSSLICESGIGIFTSLRFDFYIEMLNDKLFLYAMGQ